MEPCKVCKREFMMVNSAHVKTHGMTMDEYKEFTPPKTPFEKKEFKEYPDYSQFDTTMKTKLSFLKQYINKLIPSNNISTFYGILPDGGETTEDHICSYCGTAIYGIQLYYILNSKNDIIRNSISNDQVGMHELCALYKASSHHRVGFAFIMDVPKVSVN